MQELDAITLKRATKGDRHAFKSLYDHYAPFLWRVLFPLSERDMTTARDLLQDTFIRVNDTLRQFRGKSALSTWLYRVAYTTAMQHARKPGNRYRFHSYIDIQRGKERTDTFDNRQLAQKILDNLQPEDRFLLVAREVDGLSFDELAEITGQKAGALRTRLHRLKESVRAAYPEETYATSEV
jgi:RNA polymerase sigma-70 factor (ECF subfamily)